MNSITGKSTGIALLMAAALLAALFAMGVFSATGVSANNPDGDDNDHDHLEGLTFVLFDKDNMSISLAGVVDSNQDTPTETSPISALDTAHTGSIAVPRNASKVTVTATGGGTQTDTAWGGDSDFTVMVDGSEADVAVTAAAPAVTPAVAANGVATFPLNDGIVKAIVVTGDNVPSSGTDGTDGASRYTITLTYTGYAVNGSERTADAAVSINLNTTTMFDSALDETPAGQEDDASVARGEDVTVKLPKFGVPSVIDNTDVTVSLADGGRTPSDVTVDGTTITLTMGDPDIDGEVVWPIGPTDIVGIRFTKSAGITNPLVANENPKSYEVSVEGTGGNKQLGYGVVFREVTVKPTSGARGKEITITGKGFGDGTATISIAADGEDSGYSGKEIATDGVFTHTVATGVKNNDDDNVFAAGANTINASDFAGRLANSTATHTIKSSFSVDPENPIPGAPFTLTLKDADVKRDSDDDAEAPTVRVGSKSADLDTAEPDADDDKDTTWKYITPAGSSGSLRVRVSGLESADISQTVSFSTNPLDLSVDTAVPGQSIDITGSGFAGGKKVDGIGEISKVAIGAKDVKGTDIEGETVDANGNVSLTVTVPDDVSPGTRSVVVTDETGRTGTASITVPKPTITIDPSESRRGEAVVVTATGFPAGDVISITYNDRALADGNPGSNDLGGFTHTILVPTIATLGEGKTYKINAKALINEDANAAKAVDHKILDATVSVSPETATSGQSVDVTGMNFRGLASVTEITIAGQNVTPAGNNNADRDGTFTVTGVVVPLLNPNRYVVKVTAGEEEAIGYLTVGDMPASTDPADVFADLIANGSLSTVWHLDASTQSWTSYSTDPALADFNDLTVIPGGQVYVLIMSAADEFMGSPVFVGTNQVFIP